MSGYEKLKNRVIELEAECKLSMAEIDRLRKELAKEILAHETCKERLSAYTELECP